VPPLKVCENADPTALLQNIECRPLSIAKSEIVKRILYHNPDAEFVFCAGDDKVRWASVSGFG
jgi:trehalose 6-phosphate synthase/phosphatase